MVDQEIPTLAPFWAGHLSGTNRGRLLVRLSQNKEKLEAEAIIYDQAFGPALASLDGDLKDRGASAEKDPRATLRIWRMRSGAPVSPLDGILVLTFTEELHKATGTWQTDIGTVGNLVLRRISRWRLGWSIEKSAIAAVLFAGRAGRRVLPLLYTLAVIAVAVLTLLGKIALPYSVLVLLLLPGVFVFQGRIAGLIHALPVRRVGPVEFEQNARPPDPVGPPGPVGESGGRASRDAGEEIERARFFGSLDVFLVPRTRYLLQWLNSRQTATHEEVIAAATSFGVPPENLDATLAALIFTHLVGVSEGRFSIQPLGREYLEDFMRRVNLSPSPAPGVPVETLTS